MRGERLIIAISLALAATAAAAVEWTSPQIRSDHAEDNDLVMVYRPSVNGPKTIDMATLADPFRRYTSQSRLVKGIFDKYTSLARREMNGKEAAGTAAAALNDHLARALHPDSTSNLPEGTNLYFTSGRAAAAAPVQSVAGKTGVVTLSTSDVSEGTNLYHTSGRAAAAAPVQSVAGRTGAVSLSTSDVSGYVGPVNADWNASAGLAQILNQPSTTCASRYSWDGIDGTQIYYGSGAPSSGTGIVSDFYIDSATWNLYRKEGTPTAAWVLKGNMIGPANTLAIGTVTTLAPNQSATATITGTAPNQTLSLAIPQGATGDPGSLSRKNITDKILLADDTVIYVQPATNSPTAGGVVINDFGGNAAIIIQNGRLEVRDSGGITIAKIDRAAGTLATYDTSGNLSAKLDRDGGIYGYKASNVVGFSWTRASGALVLK